MEVLFFGSGLDYKEGEELRCFERRSSHLQVLVNKARFLASSWVLVLPRFRGLSFDLILYNWKE